MFLNSDATPADENWLSELIKALGDEKNTVAFSRQLARQDAYPLVRYDYERGYPPQSSPRMHRDFISFAAVAIKRRVWEAYKFYEEGLAEDLAWAHTLNDQGFHITYVPTSRVFHSHNLTFSALFRKEFLQGGVAAVHIYRQRRELGREVFRLSKSLIRDIIYFVRHKEWRAIPYSLAFRCVQHTAFYLGRVRGWKLLRKIKDNTNQDATVHLLREYTA